MSNLNIPPEAWLREQFEFEFCEECGGDTEHHTVVLLMGNWFARCKFPMVGDRLNPVVAAFRAEE